MYNFLFKEHRLTTIKKGITPVRSVPVRGFAAHFRFAQHFATGLLTRTPGPPTSPSEDYASIDGDCVQISVSFFSLFKISISKRNFSAICAILYIYASMLLIFS